MYTIIYKSLYICMHLQSFHYGASDPGGGGDPLGLGVGHPSCKFISGIINLQLICHILWLNFYGNVIITCLLET